MDLNYGIILGVLAMLGWGISDFLAKKAIEKIGPYRSLFYSLLLGLVILLGCTFFFLEVPYLSLTLLFLFLLGGIINFFGFLSFYKGLEIEKVSLLSPLVACNPLVIIFLSFIFLGEVLSFSQGVGIFLAVLGLILITLPQKMAHLSPKGIFLGFATMLNWGIALFLLGYLAKETHWFFAALVFRSLTFPYAPLTLKAKNLSFELRDRHLLYLLLLMALLDILATLSYNIGATTELVSLVGPIAALYPAVTLILAGIFFKERVSSLQKIGIMVILLGLLFLSL